MLSGQPTPKRQGRGNLGCQNSKPETTSLLHPLLLPALLHHRSSSSNVSVHLNIIVSSSTGRSGSCKTPGERIQVLFEGSRPQVGQMAPPSQACLLPLLLPHISSVVSSPPAPARKLQAMRGRESISISLASVLFGLQKGFSWIQ